MPSWRGENLVVPRKREDKPRIVEWFDEQEELWNELAQSARRPRVRRLMRGMARWAAGGAADYRQRIINEGGVPPPPRQYQQELRSRE